jgi:cystathionine beta-lyase family protein involved in aluminum resistance
LVRKAEANIKVALKLIDPQEESLIEFLKILLKDIRQYHTLSSRTLGRLGRKVLTIKSNEKELAAFLKAVIWIRNQLGIDYLDKIIERIKNQKSEVIIAVENRNGSYS